MKRKYMLDWEICVAKAFKNGTSVEDLADASYVTDMDVEQVIRKAMKLRRWWVPKPSRKAAPRGSRRGR